MNWLLVRVVENILRIIEVWVLSIELRLMVRKVFYDEVDVGR